jgi:hypothetical protein
VTSKEAYEAAKRDRYRDEIRSELIQEMEAEFMVQGPKLLERAVVALEKIAAGAFEMVVVAQQQKGG